MQNFASILIREEHLQEMPYGPLRKRTYTWQGDPKAMVMLDKSFPFEELPWRLVLVEEFATPVDGYVRADAGKLIEWRFRLAAQIQRTRNSLMHRIGWTLLIWNLADPCKIPQSAIWPVARLRLPWSRKEIRRD